MNNNRRLTYCLLLSILGGLSACVSHSEPAAKATIDGTPSEIKDQNTIGTQIDQYNAQSKTSAPALNDTNRTPANDHSADPAARNLARDVDAYNRTSEPDDSSSAIDGRQPATVERQRTLEQQRATQKLSQDVRNYNRSGGASSQSYDDGE